MYVFHIRYMEMDVNLYDRCARENNDKQRAKEAERNAAANKWRAILDAANSSGIQVPP